MCPNCNRGLVNGEVCLQCKGTGFWNPESLPANEVEIMEEEQNVVAEVVAEPVTEVMPEVPVEVAPEVAVDAGIQAAVQEEPKEEQVA